VLEKDKDWSGGKGQELECWSIGVLEKDKNWRIGVMVYRSDEKE
jgi:hypothetical protein